MEERRFALALLLSVMVSLIYINVYLAPQQRAAQQHANESQPTESNQPPVNQPSIATDQVSVATTKSTHTESTAEIKNLPLPDRKLVDNSPITVIETDLFRAEITQLGGRFKNLFLKQHRKTLNDPEFLNLVSIAENSPLPLGIVGTNFNDQGVDYRLPSTLANNTLMLNGSSEQSLTFEGLTQDNQKILKTFTFKGNSYLFHVGFKFTAPRKEASRLFLEWTHSASEANLSDRMNPQSFIGLTQASKIDRHLLASLAPGQSDAGALNWLGLDDKYFIAALVPTLQGPNSQVIRGENLFAARVAAEGDQGGFSVYLGPKDYDTMRDAGFSLERSIDLGIFAFLAYPLLSSIKFFHHLLGNWGLAIIALTLAIKTIFLPLTKASYNSMRAMQDLQPELKALKERIKDPAQLNQETMALFKKRGVNPMGGCFPMLIQIPVFLGLYNALLNAIELRHAPFALWITDLSDKEYLRVGGVGIPVMVLLMGASMYYQMKSNPTPSADPTQQKVMRAMPFVFTAMFIIYPMPSGLVLYWLVNNIISITQQVFLRNDRKSGPLKATLIASVGIFVLGFILTLI